MRHVTLTCLHHPALRWQCKDIAVNSIGQYIGVRNIFYMGNVEKERYSPECRCPGTDLRFAPEELERQKTEPLEVVMRKREE